MRATDGPHRVLQLTTPQEKGRDHEREVIALCLDRLFIGERQVVRSPTRSGLGLRSDRERMLRSLRENLPELKESTVSGFRRANREQHGITPDFDPKSCLVPVDDRRFRHLFRDDEGWDRFREAFPDSDGTLRISRVGFDQSCTQALLYTGQQFDWTVGLSGFWLFERSLGGWELAGRAGTDVS
ncbi:hypothetical protein [Rubrobacter indicoceani]|uniref:hypothetical protein n=1 Tax=Rubrobacter indicoceani TaxID=2051957 RepID=UPI000E5B7B86|nr:hypothetical protein [Rubrobacter indicoceani]